MTVLPTEEPDTIPHRAEEMTATLAGPPGAAPASALARLMKNCAIPVTAAIFCGSVYGHTENAADLLANRLAQQGVQNIALYDVSHTDVSLLVSEAFRCSHLVFAASTYNNGIFTPMENLLLDLKAHNLHFISFLFYCIERRDARADFRK